MQKIRYMIKINECLFIIIYIDYSTTISIFKQINFIIFNTNKFNLRLIKALQYLFNFNITMKHKFNKLNIVLNTLSCLQANVVIIEKVEVLKLLYKSFIQFCNNDLITNISKLLLIYYIILIKIIDDFKRRLKEAYN